MLPMHISRIQSLTLILIKLRIRTIPTATFLLIALEAFLRLRRNRVLHGIKHRWNPRSESWLGLGYG